MSRLDEIRERERAATEGPWNKAPFLANARQDIPWLLRYIDELEKLIGEVDGSCGENLAEVRARVGGWDGMRA